MRAALQAATDEVPVLLVTITHPDLEAPVRLSSDPTTPISLEPYVMGTRSNGADYIYLIRSYRLPDDPDGGTPGGQLVITDLDGAISRSARALTNGYPIINFDIVLASSPDLIEDSLHDEIEVVSASWSGGALTLDLQAINYDEPVPAHRMSKRYFPGLHK
ncbi:hypothetical protein C5689_06205 [Methylosinus sporium]|uniref:DUF1833 domain-containing protein n=2 Tax=Methylosinus sporium TaxID=428 RepID=A0A2U1SSS6_METSR|nr:hypothetical protein C5689_06205 [Methylosinus sporium]